MAAQQPNIPNTGQRTVRAYMRVKSFISPASPNAKQLEKFDKEVNAFLHSIDNQKRFLNGRNSYSIGDRVYTLVWYLEKIPEKPVTVPFGAKDAKQPKPVKPDTPQEKKTK